MNRDTPRRFWTDEENQDIATSNLSTKALAEKYGVTVKAIYSKRARLRSYGAEIPDHRNTYSVEED